MDFFLFEKLP